MGISQLEAFCGRRGIPCSKNEMLREHCTFLIGGPAGLFIEPSSEQELIAVVKSAKELGVKFMILGNGSNVLFSDEGYHGAVIHIRHGFTGIRLVDRFTVECGGGASMTSLTQFALENGLTGLEFAYGIPGSVGGGVYMNAGAYVGEMRNALIEIFHITDKGEAGSLHGESMKLGYRHSAYCENGFIITRARFKLIAGDKERIKADMDDYMSRRRDKQPLELPSAGSTFKRPVGGYASELIDRCGLKGKRVGGAMVSEKHAGFVVNAGGAACKDVLDLINFIKDTVKEKTGIELTPEIRVIEP